MNAVDTNLLVYAHREECQWHPQARDCLANLAASPAPWAIPWPCVHEFLAIATHPRIYDPPTPTAIALDQVKAWVETPNLVLLAESPGYWDKLHRLIETGRIAGPTRGWRLSASTTAWSLPHRRARTGAQPAAGRLRGSCPPLPSPGREIQSRPSRVILPKATATQRPGGQPQPFGNIPGTSG